MIKVSAVITTLNAAESLPRCLQALQNFDDIIVFDSNSNDITKEICKKYNARYEGFTWNGAYPKKRQYFLDNIETKHDFIFFVDADEVVTTEQVQEIKNLTLDKAGYFVKGQYHYNGKLLKHGLQNNKLALIDRRKIEFPVIDDLGHACMGEMEGHYQPVLKPVHRHESLGQLRTPLIHYAYDDEASWHARHDRYARWEADMILNDKYPIENNAHREKLKSLFRSMPMRRQIAFAHSYIYRLGILDRKAGYAFAKSRYAYYKKVSAILKANKA